MSAEFWPLLLGSREAANEPVPRSRLRRLLARLAQNRRPRAIGELSELNAYLLRDIGVCAQDVETAKWFWHGGWGEIASIRDRHHRC